MILEEIDEQEFTQGTKEPELKEDLSLEHLKYLVDHFRKLALDKDTVIIQYREILERFKDSATLAQEYKRQIEHQKYLLSVRQLKIDSLESQLKKLKKPDKTTKQKKDKKHG